MDILGPDREFNTAYVSFEVMLCDASTCPKCSPDGSIDESPTSGLPRVHSRHLNSDKKFIQKNPYLYGYQNEDAGDEFPDEAPTFPDLVKFWDVTMQEVVTCLGVNCEGCQEMRRQENDTRPNMASYREKLRQEMRRGPRVVADAVVVVVVDVVVRAELEARWGAL
jgi:hypothetical protein